MLNRNLLIFKALHALELAAADASGRGFSTGTCNLISLCTAQQGGTVLGSRAALKH